MKRLFILLAMVLFCTPLSAQQQSDAEYAASAAKMQTKVFELHNRMPNDVYMAIRLLGTPLKPAEMMPSNDMRTITIRDYPEKVVEIGEAIKRLDAPLTAPAAIEFRIAVLVGSKSPLSGQAVPNDLAPVVKQLQSTLAYSNYSLVASIVQRAAVTRGSVEGSGVVEAVAVGGDPKDRPVRYNYHFESLQLDSLSQPPTVGIQTFSFTLMYPTSRGTEPVGFKTPVTMHDNEKVVIGTASMNDKALIVVLTAHFAKAVARSALECGRLRPLLEP